MIFIKIRLCRWKNHDTICWIKSKLNQSSLIDGCSEDKKARGTKKKKKKCVIKRKLKFENYKNFLETTKLENKIKHLKQ